MRGKNIPTVIEPSQGKLDNNYDRRLHNECCSFCSLSVWRQDFKYGGKNSLENPQEKIKNNDWQDDSADKGISCQA